MIKKEALRKTETSPGPRLVKIVMPATKTKLSARGVPWSAGVRMLKVTPIQARMTAAM